MKNGELLAKAETEGYEAFVTTDGNLKYQQNVHRAVLRIMVLTTTSWPRIQLRVDAVRRAVESAAAGAYAEVDID